MCNRPEQQTTAKRGMGVKSKLYQFSSIYRHFILNKGAVVRDEFDRRSVDSYYLCTIVLFDVSKNSDIVHSHELSSKDVIDQCPKGGGNEESGAAMWRGN